jgi:hypothetical protein
VAERKGFFPMHAEFHGDSALSVENASQAMICDFRPSSSVRAGSRRFLSVNSAMSLEMSRDWRRAPSHSPVLDMHVTVNGCEVERRA